mgnify:CR=1 FL=1
MIHLNIGSNLESKFGNRFKNISTAIDLLINSKLKINKISNFYETPSYPNKKKPKFLNIAIEISFLKSPADLMRKIFFIEKKMGRIRIFKNEPRICDIDIIDFNKEVIKTKNIILPHPKAHIRNFVLYPLKEICPDWSHPVNNKKIGVLIKNLPLKTRNEITKLK